MLYQNPTSNFWLYLIPLYQSKLYLIPVLSDTTFRYMKFRYSWIRYISFLLPYIKFILSDSVISNSLRPFVLSRKLDSARVRPRSLICFLPVSFLLSFLPHSIWRLFEAAPTRDVDSDVIARDIRLLFFAPLLALCSVHSELMRYFAATAIL